jgi:tRNA threonylcarbamoyl adenosine modification protein YjeE
MTAPFLTVTSSTAAGTAALGAALAPWLEPGDVLLLHGDLGAGKTTLAKGIAAALGVEAVVSSPSFGLVNEYALNSGTGAARLHHLDLYRIDEDELDSIGFAELVASPDAVTLVEWPERAGHHLPDRYLLVEIVATGEGQRRFGFVAHPDDERWHRRIPQLRALLAEADSS